MRIRTVSRVVIAGVIVIFVAIAAVAATTPRGEDGASRAPGYEDAGSLLNGRPAPQVSLRDQTGHQVSLAGLRGHAVILTFFYTHCPDTCPLTAQKIRAALTRLGREASRVSVVVVTTDPLHDNPRNAAAFLRRNGRPSWHFLLGRYSQLAPVWKEYAIYAPPAGVSQTAGPGHSTYMYLIDALGREQALLGDKAVTANALEQNLHILLDDHHWLVKLPIAPTVGAIAPPISLAGLHGGIERLAGFRGKPLLINFWATWCVPCRTEMPLLARTYHRYRGQLNILGIDEQEPANPVQAFVRQFRAMYPIALDTTGTAMYAYQIGFTPTTYFLDAQGVIVHVTRGEVRPAEMAAQLRSLLPTTGMMG